MSRRSVPPTMRFIFNPRSGYNLREPGLLQRTRDFIAQHGLAATVVQTESPRHATALAREAALAGCSLVVAVGGDGTMNEVASGLAGTEAVLGLVPCGSGNGLARHLGLRAHGADALPTLLHGRIRQIDMGLVNGRPFFNVMGVGFDAEVASRFSHLTRRGLPAYVSTVFRTWRDYQPAPYRVSFGGQEIAAPAFLLAVANSAQYGNDCYIAPKAEVDDGQLDLTLVRKVNLANAPELAWHLFHGSLNRSDQVVIARHKAFVIERAAPGPVHTDGELHELEARLEIHVRPQSLRVQVPA